MSKYLSPHWSLKFSTDANKKLHKLEKHVKQRIVDYFEQNVLTQKNPRIKGKPLSGKLAGHWSYRVGNFRVLTQIQDNEMIILAVGVGHRRDVYKI